MNPRPPGYEPDELPLLHAASFWRTDLVSQRASRQYLRRCGVSRPGSGWVGVGPPRSPHASGSGGCRRVAMPRLFPPARFPHGSPRPCAPLASTGHPASSRGRLPGHLPGGLRLFQAEYPHLAAPFPLRCFQRFWLPDVATQPAGRPTTAPPAVRPRRSSRTKRSSPQDPNRP